MLARVMIKAKGFPASTFLRPNFPSPLRLSAVISSNSYHRIPTYQISPSAYVATMSSRWPCTASLDDL